MRKIGGKEGLLMTGNFPDLNNIRQIIKLNIILDLYNTAKDRMFLTIWSQIEIGK